MSTTTDDRAIRNLSAAPSTLIPELPHDVGAEEAVLGSILLNRDAISPESMNAKAVHAE